MTEIFSIHKDTQTKYITAFPAQNSILYSAHTLTPSTKIVVAPIAFVLCPFLFYLRFLRSNAKIYVGIEVTQVPILDTSNVIVCLT